MYRLIISLKHVPHSYYDQQYYFETMVEAQNFLHCLYDSDAMPDDHFVVHGIEKCKPLSCENAIEQFFRNTGIRLIK